MEKNDFYLMFAKRQEQLQQKRLNKWISVSDVFCDRRIFQFCLGIIPAFWAA
jgi:hypothetical protein